MPAALLLTRVVSRPTATRVTFDLGYKAVASDPPAGQATPHDSACRPTRRSCRTRNTWCWRCPTRPDFRPGDEALAIPTHVCPTVAMHQFAYVVEGGKLVGTWEIVGRNRTIGV